MKPEQRRSIGPGSIVLALVVVVVLLALATRRSRTFSVGQTIQLDDFFFTVEEAARLPAGPAMAGEAGSSAPGVDYRILLRVDNRALRAPFNFHGRSLVLTDPTGGFTPVFPYAELQPDGCRQPVGSHVLAAGESATFECLFSVPWQSRMLRLRFMPGGWSGDLLEWLLFGRKEFLMP